MISTSPSLGPAGVSLRHLRHFAFLGTLMAGLPAAAQVHAPPKTLTGTVTNGSSQPMAGVHVLLQAVPLKLTRSYITDAQGHYRFNNLDSHTDYRVWARYKGRDSSKSRVSKFDANANPTISISVSAP